MSFGSKSKKCKNVYMFKKSMCIHRYVYIYVCTYVLYIHIHSCSRPSNVSTFKTEKNMRFFSPDSFILLAGNLDEAAFDKPDYGHL